MATTVECKCGALYEASSFLGGHTFTCNACGAQVTIRDLSFSKTEPAATVAPARPRPESNRADAPRFLTADPGMVWRLVQLVRFKRARAMLAELSPLNAVQRVLSFIGLVVLLLLVVYPEYETSYYLWVDSWYRLGGTTQRAFVADIRHGEIVGVIPAGDPELRHLIDFRDNSAKFERRTAIRIWSVALQGALVIALTALAVWLSGSGKKGDKA